MMHGQRNIKFIFSGRCVGYFDHGRWEKYVTSKGRDLITHWRSIIIPKKRFPYLHSCENVKTRTWKVSSFSRGFYTLCFDMWYGWLPWLNVPECNSKLRYVSRTALFWVITQRVVLIYYRRFGTNYRPHFQGSIIFWILQGSRIRYLLDPWPLKTGPI
jgi:hypothetical protein